MNRKVNIISVLLLFMLILSLDTVSASDLDNTIGISEVNKVLLNDAGARYALVVGEKVRVGSVNNNGIVIIDTEGHIFQADRSDVRLEKVSHDFDNILDENTVKRNSVINSSFFKLDTPYVYGAVGPTSYDCSGFTYQIYKNELGIDLKRVSRDQFTNGIDISRENLLPGDLVFFKSNGVTIGHVGIYIGDDNMIHASSGAKKVVVSSLSSPWYSSRYAGAKRLIY